MSNKNSAHIKRAIEAKRPARDSPKKVAVLTNLIPEKLAYDATPGNMRYGQTGGTPSSIPASLKMLLKWNKELTSSAA